MSRLPPRFIPVLTILAGLMGGYGFYLAHLPAPWLTGAMVTMLVLIGLSFRPSLPMPLRDFAMLMTGIALGSAITPEMLAALGRYPISLLLLAATTLGIVLAGRWVLTRFFDFSNQEAMFAALPGALSAVLASAAEAKVDLVRITALQAFRLFILVALLPSILASGLHPIVKGQKPIIGVEAFAIEMGLGLALGLILARFGMVAPYLLGGMLVAGLGHANRALTGFPPDPLVNFGMVLIGIFISTRFASINGATMRSLLLPASVLFGVTIAVSALGIAVLLATTPTPLAEAIIAFAPGALEAMVALGVAMGLDPLYVSSHHIARFLLIAFFAPMLAMSGRKSG
jgi:uncharacterized protein